MSSNPAANLRGNPGHGHDDGPATDVADVLDRLRRIALLAAGAGIGLLLFGLLVHRGRAFFQSYLYAYVFWTGLALGCFALLMLQHLVGGAWGAVIQRPLEAGARLLPLMALLFLPLALTVAFGRPYLYEWLDQPWRDKHANLHFKLWYLSRGGFLLRAVIYFVVWTALAWVLNGWSARQDRSADPRVGRQMQFISGPGLVLYVVTVSLAAVDWVMSLSPDWYSTIFGLLWVVGQVLATLAVMVALLAMLAGRRPLSGVLAVGHFHDLGNLLLAFVMLWAYLSFSQFLIIWSGNIADETPYYYARTRTGWKYVALLLVMFHFFVPFILLLWRRTKRSPRTLTMVAAALLVMRLVDLFWVMGPSFIQNSPAHFRWWHGWMFPAAAAGMGGIWVLAFVWQLRRRPLLPLNDPRITPAPAGAHDG
jgi:hypothetical protein